MIAALLGACLGVCRGETAWRIIRTTQWLEIRAGPGMSRAGGIGCALAIILTACGQQQPATKVAAPAAKAAVPAAAAPAAKAETASACAPAPQLVLGEGFNNARGAFAAGSGPFRRLEANFAAAYRASCTPGLLQRHALIEAGASERDRLRVKNAPDANVASIYLDGEEGAPASRRHMVLEYPFLTANGTTHVPSESDLRETIFCAVQGASQQEEDESGRCLPD